MSSKPTFILIPGAWHTPVYFTPLITLLSSPPYSYPCLTIPLPSVLSSTSSTALNSFDPDVEAIRRGVEKVLDSGSDAVLVTHSYGGVPASEAMKYFRDGGREGRGKVKRMVWVSSFVLGVGGSLMEALGGEDLVWFGVDVSF